MSLSILHPSSSEYWRQKQRGLTLVEILVAISLLGLLLASVYGVFSSISKTRGRLDNASSEYHKARVIFDRLGRELRGTYFRPDNSELAFSGGLADDGFLEFTLTTSAVTPLSQTGSGIAKVYYRIAADHENSGKGLVLFRRERPVHLSSSDGPSTGMMRFAPGIKTMSLRFFKNGEWATSWDGLVSGLPDLVEITLEVITEDETLASFITAFDLPKTVPR